MDPRKLSQLMYLGHHTTHADWRENTSACHVCLCPGPLTWEHVPPRSAFNEYDCLWDHLAVQKGTADHRRARLRGGFRVQTLCKRCNQRVCSPYAAEYVRFVKDLVAAPRIFASSGKGRILCVQQDTLLLAKEIATMILAIESLTFAKHNSELRQFVVDPTLTIESGFRVLAFLVPDSEKAGTILHFHARVDSFAPGYAFVGGEISMYPFGFVYASEIGVEYDLDRFTDISHWFRAGGPERKRSLVTLHPRITGVDSIQTGLGIRRIRPQIDQLPTDAPARASAAPAVPRRLSLAPRWRGSCRAC